MMLRPAIRRLVIALIGLALTLPSALPQAAAAPATNGLPAALAFVCGNLQTGAAGDEQGDRNAADHQSCQTCAGACHGMVLAAAAMGPTVVQAWVHDFAVPGDVVATARGDLSGYASRAPPLA